VYLLCCICNDVISLSVAGKAAEGSGSPQFYSALQAHATDANRVAIGLEGGWGESLDSLETVKFNTATSSSFDDSGRSIIYGSATDAELLYLSCMS
jgi:hypothetical protein